MSIKADERTCLQNTFPSISAEWHPSKNGDLTPEKVTAKSGKKVWWLCKEGHEWEALISNRTKNMSGCPYCAGKRAIVGVNDLQTVNPDLAEEWHPVKNGNIRPTDVMSSSGKKYWWKCKEGHEWQAALDSRKRGAGCPFCSGRYAITGKTDLLSQRPDIAALWHPNKNGDVKPNTVTVASGRMFWWLGPCGHEWKTRVSTMCSKQGLEICPICSSENRTSFPEQAIYYYILQKFDDALSRYAAHKKEIDIFIPSLSVGIEYDGMRYHTPNTEEKEKDKDLYFQKRGIRTFRIKEYTEERITHNDFTVYYDPSNNYKRLTQAIILLFELISEYADVGFADVDVDTDRDNAAILSLFLKKKKENSLGKVHPSLLKEWDSEKNKGLNPMLIGMGSNHKFWWKCYKGHEWKASVNERANHGTGCPYCAGNILLVGENDLETVSPDLAKEWNYEKNKDLKPSDVTARGNRKVWWRCKQSHEWIASISSRQRGNGCPYCSGRIAIEGETDLLSTHPQLANEWVTEKNDIAPQSVKAGSNVKVWWRGKCGHVYEMKISDRTRGCGCPYCAGKRVLTGFNDLQTTNPELSEEWLYEKNAQLTPQDVMPGSSKSVWWKCKEGHVWKAIVASRTRGNGCPYCSGRIAWKGKTDIVTTNPEVAAFWDYEKNKGIDIYSCVSGSEKIVYWQCPKGHSWKNMIKKQVKTNLCPVCSPDKKTRIHQWREDNPNGSKTQCSYETGISYPTVRKWWDYSGEGDC